MPENMRCLIEPSEYVRLFAQHPPKGFSFFCPDEYSPCFRAELDILTTTDPKFAARIRRLPCYGFWGRLLRHKSLFVGSTITEYSPIFKGADPNVFLSSLLNAVKSEENLLIIKDLPQNSPLLSKEDNDWADLLSREAEKRGFIRLEGEALAYLPLDFSNEEEWLSRFSSARRKNFRRKFRSLRQLDIEELPLGDPRFDNADFLRELYAMYGEVYAQSEIHFDYLSEEFFTALFRSKDIHGVCIFYYDKEKGRKLIGWNVSLIHKTYLIDKFIGFHYPDARDRDLYFVSWMINLRYALQRGLSIYVAGWTDPAVKASLGAHFTMTHHLVWIRPAWLRFIAKHFASFFESDAAVLESARQSSKI